MRVLLEVVEVVDAAVEEPAIARVTQEEMSVLDVTREDLVDVRGAFTAAATDVVRDPLAAAELLQEVSATEDGCNCVSLSGPCWEVDIVARAVRRSNDAVLEGELPRKRREVCPMLYFW